MDKRLQAPNSLTCAYKEIRQKLANHTQILMITIKILPNLPYSRFIKKLRILAADIGQLVEKEPKSQVFYFHFVT